MNFSTCILHKSKVFAAAAFLLITAGMAHPAHSQQPRLVKDYSFVMEMAGIQALESSLTHLYVLSEAEGLSVFRTQPDTLQWLYTTPGMSQRGHQLEADVRFAYLHGNNRRFSVIEPTSVVGVYSATNLPTKARGVHRLGTNLYVGLGERGVGQLSLRSPSAFDSAVTYPLENHFKGSRPLDLTGDAENMYISTDNSAILHFSTNNQKIELENKISTDQSFSYIYWHKDKLYVASSKGNIFLIQNNGRQRKIGAINEKVVKIRPWKKWLIIRGESGRLWTSFDHSEPTLWKDNQQAGNYFTINKGQFWINEYNKIARIKQVAPLAESRKDTLGLFVNINSIKLQSIQNYTTPLPHPILVPIQLEEEYPVEAIQYAYESSTIEDAYMRKQGFYWQPGSNDVGTHQVTIIATASSGVTDSTSFAIEVKSFNSPPRFSPLRSVTIPAGETYTMSFSAFDPDGSFPDLIRYLGMNLPEGSQINQSTGEFEWTPSPDQTGKHTFEVIATDQFGAASSEKVSLKVISKPTYDQ